MPAIDKYLKFAVTRGASDLHLAGNTRPMMRVHGTMMPALGDETPVLGEVEMNQLVDEIMPDPSASELEKRLDTDFAYSRRPQATIARRRFRRLRHRLGRWLKS